METIEDVIQNHSTNHFQGVPPSPHLPISPSPHLHPISSQDVIHGMWTVFPIPLAEASSWEPLLAQRTARATALETTSSGIHWTFATWMRRARVSPA